VYSGVTDEMVVFDVDLFDNDVNNIAAIWMPAWLGKLWL